MSRPEALAFDMYGTLVNPLRIWQQLEQFIPGDTSEAQRIAEVWRQKQLEFTFRLTVMEQYEDFEQVTRKALDYALAMARKHLDTDQKNMLMAQYNDLERFADVEPGLQRLKGAGYTMVVFSNGSPAMLDAIMQAAQLHEYFQGFISVDEVKVYKPSPKVYRHVAERLGRAIENVADVIQSLRCYWSSKRRYAGRVDRSLRRPVRHTRCPPGYRRRNPARACG